MTQQLSLMVLNSEQLVGSHVVAQYHFDLLGGTLGSSAQDDWQLQDRLGGVLAAHARIECHDGRFCLCDLSGQTYLQGGTTPLGRGRKVYLQQGDELNVGPLRLLAYVGAQPATSLPHTLLLSSESGLEQWLAPSLAPAESIPEAPHLVDPLLALQQESPPLLSSSASGLESDAPLPLACQPAFIPPALFSALTAGEKRMNQECVDMPTIDHFATSVAGPTLSPGLCPGLRPGGASAAGGDVMGKMGRPGDHASGYVCLRWVLSGLLLLLSGCTTLGKMADVIMDPDIQVGSNSEQPSTLGVTLLAEPDVNPNGSGEAAPVELQLVWLAEDSKLLASDYDQLAAGPKEALGKNYLDHQEFTLLPGQYKYLPPAKLDEQTRYIGVIAHYADPERAQWRKVIKVKGKGQAYQLLIHLRCNEVQLQTEEE